MTVHHESDRQLAIGPVYWQGQVTSSDERYENPVPTYHSM